LDETEVILRRLGGKSSVRFLPATYRGLDADNRALVDCDGGRVPAYVLPGMAPMLNEPVWVEIVDGVAYMHGPTTLRSDEGTIVTAADGVAELTTATGDVTASYENGIPLTPGDVVRLSWGPSGAWIMGVAVEAVPPVVPPSTGGGGGRRTVEFTALDSGSFQPGYGWRTNEVWSSLSNRGAWFYGSQLRDTIPDSASIVSAQIYLPAPAKIVGGRPFGRHSFDSKPAGAITATDTSTLPGTSGWVDIPTSLIDHLKSNPGGLGFNNGGDNRWPGTQRDGQSGRVRVTFDS
jgi:hypothetical protein